VAAAKYLAATAIDLIEHPNLLANVRAEHADRVKDTVWKSRLPDGLQPPIYQPPDDFLRRTGQKWPPATITWPVEPIIAKEKLGTVGPALRPIS
jgi:aminobenzoyl-glutamate utilization protein B